MVNQGYDEEAAAANDAERPSRALLIHFLLRLRTA